jgi:hypothetical protein
LYDDTLWGDELKLHGFRLIYDREIEALHKHHIDYQWFVNRAYKKGRTAMRLYASYPNSADFTKVERDLEEIRNLNTNTHIGSPNDMLLLESMMKEEYLLYENRLQKMEGYYERLKLMQTAARMLGRVHDYYKFKGVLSTFTLNEQTKNALSNEYFFQHSPKSSEKYVLSSFSHEIEAVLKLILKLAEKIKSNTFLYTFYKLLKHKGKLCRHKNR